MEHIQFFNLIEYVIPAIKFNGLTEAYAKSLLRLTLNELYYNLQLSRNVNFRESDQTGIANYKDPRIYEERLKKMEGKEVFNILESSEIFVTFQTHELMTDLDIIDRLDLDYNFIELYRNPIDIAYSWIKRGWGIRFFGTEENPKGYPSSMTLSFSNDGKFIPWYCANYDAEEFFKLNEYERAVFIVLDLIKTSITKHKNAKKPEKILTLSFEAILVNPRKELKKISSFLGIKLDENIMEFFIKLEDLPKEYDSKKHKDKMIELENNINSDLFLDLQELQDQYNNSVYNLV